MKRYISSILALSLLFCMVACTAAEQHTSSEALLSLSPEIVSETEMESSETSSYDAVTSINNSSATNTNHTTTSPSVFSSSNQTSSVNNPYISYGGKTGSELVYISPAPKAFSNNEDLVHYLKTGDLKKRNHDVIADEKIYLIPRVVDNPKSRAAKSLVEKLTITDSQTGYFFTWSFTDNMEKRYYFITWYTAEEYQNQSIKTPEELLDFVCTTINTFSDSEKEIIRNKDQFYVRVHRSIYWLHDGKYLVSAYNSLDRGNREELILLAQDIVFDKHTLK